MHLQQLQLAQLGAVEVGLDSDFWQPMALSSIAAVGFILPKEDVSSW
jgi:hypothetical protein